MKLAVRIRHDEVIVRGDGRGAKLLDARDIVCGATKQRQPVEHILAQKIAICPRRQLRTSPSMHRGQPGLDRRDFGL